MLENKSTLLPKKGHQPDKYVGGIDPKTKLRNGSGVYRFANSYFTYEGNYNQGIKSGRGMLKMKDGTVIEGIFENGQLNGPAKIVYPDGSQYTGDLKLGEKNGYGSYTSMLQAYVGQWNNNQRHGKGKFTNTLSSIEGQFKNNKPDGKCTLRKWNYQFQGEFKAGLKHGNGIEKDLCDQFSYDGAYQNDLFHGKGQFQSFNPKLSYLYNGEFNKGNPTLYPNQWRVSNTITKKEGQNITQTDPVIITNAIQLQLESEPLNIYIDSVYQGPQMLDEIQPTQEEIDKMIKDWQNQNKKNKNPPPMPDFNQPRMKKPELVVVQQQSKRQIQIRLIRTNAQNQQQYMKFDYRQAIIKKRQQNQLIAAQAAKKAQEEGNKKGGKKDNKGQPQLKVNIFNDNPTEAEKYIQIQNQNGKAQLKQIQLPDDFPLGKYTLLISSKYNKFGQIPQRRIQFNVKPKQQAKKK